MPSGVSGVNDVVEETVLITQAEHVVAVGSVGNAAWLVVTMTRYTLAPETADQVKVGFVETAVALLAGEESVGGSNVGSVVKPRCSDHVPGWSEFPWALTCQ